MNFGFANDLTKQRKREKLGSETSIHELRRAHLERNIIAERILGLPKD